MSTTFDPKITAALSGLDDVLASLELSTTNAHSLAGLSAIREAVQTVASEPEDTNPPPPPPEPEDPDGDPPEERLRWALRVLTMARLRCAGTTAPAVTMTSTTAKAGAVATH